MTVRPGPGAGSDSGPGPSPEEPSAFGERVLDLFVYGPAGLVVTVAEHGPDLVARGREQLGARLASARAVGEFSVRFGTGALRRQVEDLLGGGRHDPAPPARPPGTNRLRAVRGTGGDSGSAAAPDPVRAPSTRPRTAPGASGGVDRNVPMVESLGIPGFDTLSASQVVQRLAGLSRSELVAMRAYEAASRGRRTILSRIDQLLDERA